jgi:hypothetical protein
VQITEISGDIRLERLRAWLPWIFLACSTANLINYAIILSLRATIPDFTVFWAAAHAALLNPSMVYDSAALTVQQMWLTDQPVGIRPWAYPPTALLPLLPLTNLSFPVAFLCFTIGTAAAFALVAGKILKIDWRFGLLFLAVSDACLFAAINGQMTFLIGAMILGGLSALPSRQILAGFLLGVAAAIKPQMLIFAPVCFVASRRYAALVSFCLTGMLMILLTLPLGLSLWVDWLSSIPKFLEIVERVGILDRNVTPTGILWNLGLSGAPLRIAGILFTGLGGVLVWNVFCKNSDWQKRLVALVGGALLCSPYAMNYELVLLAPAAISCLLRGLRFESSLLLMASSGIFLSSYGALTPPIALAFILFVLKDEIHLPRGLSLPRRIVAA